MQIAIEVGDDDLLDLCFQQVVFSAPTSSPLCILDPTSNSHSDIVKQALVELLAVARMMSLSQVKDINFY